MKKYKTTYDAGLYYAPYAPLSVHTPQWEFYENQPLVLKVARHTERFTDFYTWLEERCERLVDSPPDYSLWFIKYEFPDNETKILFLMTWN